MHTVFALLCFVVVIHLLIFPYPSGLLHWHCGNLTIAPVPAKQPWWIWINTSCEFIMNDCITTIKQSTTKLCAYFLGYTLYVIFLEISCTDAFNLLHNELFKSGSVITYISGFYWATKKPKLGWHAHNVVISGESPFGFSEAYHQGTVRHIGISKLGHNLNQCFPIVNWTLGYKIQWNLNKKQQLSYYKINWKILTAWLWSFCLHSNVLLVGNSGWMAHFNSLWSSDAIDLGQNWFRQWFVAWRHQAITWIKPDSSSMSSVKFT